MQLYTTDIYFTCSLAMIGDLTISEHCQDICFRLTICRNDLTDLLFWDWLESQQGVNLDGTYDSKRGLYSRVVVIYDLPKSTNKDTCTKQHTVKAIKEGLDIIDDYFQTYLKETKRERKL